MKKRHIIILFILAVLLTVLVATPVYAAFRPYYDFFTSSTADGYCYSWDINFYTTAWGSVNSDSVSTGGAAYQSNDPPVWGVTRGFLFFDTSELPDDAVVTSAELRLYGTPTIAPGGASTKSVDIVIQQGDGTHPQTPLVIQDFNRAFYSGNGGSINTDDWTHNNGWNSITLNDTGMGWIDPEGVTVFVVRTSDDIAGTSPTGVFDGVFYASGNDPAHLPKLLVYYNVPEDDGTNLMRTVLPVIVGIWVAISVMIGFLVNPIAGMTGGIIGVIGFAVVSGMLGIL